MVALRRLVNAGHILFLEGNGLLGNDVDALVHRLNGCIRVQIGGQADVEYIQFFLFQHLRQACVVTLAGVGLHLLRADVAQGDQLSVLHLLPAGNVGAADAAHANQTNLQHGFILHILR